MSYIKLIYKYDKNKFSSADDAVFIFLDDVQSDFPDLVPVYENDAHLSCIIKRTELKKFRDQVSYNRNFEFTSSELIEDINWLERCQELWQELQIKDLTITQIADPGSCNIQPSKNQILIQPGTGFGTGHHACTAMLIELIQEQTDLKDKIRQSLDFGTGSGILALVIAKVFETKILAIDNDALALENTRTNLKLNPTVSALITIEEACRIPENLNFDLIVANIYSSLLGEMQEQFFQALPKNARLLVSGILNDQIDEVLESYRDPKWKVLKHLKKTDDYKNVWHALVLER